MKKLKRTEPSDNIEDLIDLAKRDPVKAARRCQKEVANLEGGYQHDLRKEIGVGYAIAFKLAKDDDAWSSFLKQPFWQKRRKRLTYKDRENVLLHSMVFIFSALTKQVYDRAHKYSTALQPFWTEGVHPKKVAAEVLEKGPELLLKMARQHPKEEETEQSQLELPTIPLPVENMGGDGERAQPKRRDDDEVVQEDAEPTPRAEDDIGDGNAIRKLLQLTARSKIRKLVKKLGTGEKAVLTIVGPKPDGGLPRAVKFEGLED
jgi:hypothetical protein